MLLALPPPFPFLLFSSSSPAPFLSLLLLEATFKGGLPHMAPCVLSTNVLIKFNAFLTQTLNCHKTIYGLGDLVVFQYMDTQCSPKAHVI